MIEDKDCRECGLPVQEYKQILQVDEEVCEPCSLASIGAKEFPSTELD